MDAHIKKVYVPMTETGFYILLCLRSPNHGYGIVQKVKEITDNEVILLSLIHIFLVLNIIPFINQRL